MRACNHERWTAECPECEAPLGRADSEPLCLAIPPPVAPALSGRRVLSAPQEHLSILSREDLDDMAALTKLREIAARAPHVLVRVRDLLYREDEENRDRRARGLIAEANAAVDRADTLRILIKLGEPRAVVGHAPKVQASEPAREGQ